MKLIHLIIFVVGLATAATDPLLGTPFQVHPITAGDSGQYKATLIEYPFQKDSTRVPKGMVLYVHGYNDYFFQKELALKTDSAGYAFFAIDLHNYGRSLQPGDHHGTLRAMTDYYAEMDSAIQMMRNANPNLPIALLGHSTGGLLTSLYVHDRNRGKNFAALILNSPFFEMNKNWAMRKVFIPLASKLGQYYPDFKLETGKDDNYARSLLKNMDGEWEFDQNLKWAISPTQDLGWLRAIHIGHFRVQKGLKIQTPVLLMHSNCSIVSDEWVEEFTRCDGVLDVDQISLYGHRIGEKITEVTIENGLHDLFLSKKEARDKAYKEYLQFLDDQMSKP